MGTVIQYKSLAITACSQMLILHVLCCPLVFKCWTTALNFPLDYTTFSLSLKMFIIHTHPERLF